MTLPKTLQEKGSQLVSRLKTTKWNDRGELLHEGVAIPGSNIVDLIHDLLRNRKTVDPIGWQQFANQMHAANIPMELVGNVARRQHIQKRTRIAPPIPNPKKNKKKKTRQLPDAWESYKNQSAESRSSHHGSTVHGSGNHNRRRHHNQLSNHIADDITTII